MISTCSSSRCKIPALPVQYAAYVGDVLHGDFNVVVSVESLRGSSHTVAGVAPADGGEASIPAKTVEECSTRESCIDEYLWSVYQRAPKEDTVKVVERKKVTVEVEGKTRTISKELTKLVDEDFQAELRDNGVKVIPLDPGDLDAAAETWDESKLEEIEIEPLSALGPLGHESEWEWEGRTFPTYVFDTPGQVIWGATARILRGFLDALESPKARTG